VSNLQAGWVDWRMTSQPILRWRRRWRGIANGDDFAIDPGCTNQRHGVGRQDNGSRRPWLRARPHRPSSARGAQKYPNLQAFDQLRMGRLGAQSMGRSA